MNRQQRDTTLPSTGRASARRSVSPQSTQFVDLDVNSPEITILDDNNLGKITFLYKFYKFSFILKIF